MFYVGYQIMKHENIPASGSDRSDVCVFAFMSEVFKILFLWQSVGESVSYLLSLSLPVRVFLEISVYYFLVGLPVCLFVCLLVSL